ncbi:hypothetical protein M8C21_015146, partial [Ambrosia artemisiifolia]
ILIMGDAAVSALVKEVVGRITSELIKEFRLFRGFQKDILTLKNEFLLNEVVLEDADEKQNKDKAVQVWLKSLKSATMEAENVLDEVSTQALLQRLQKKRGRKYRVRAFFSSDHNTHMFRVRIAHKVKAIRAKLDDIASKRLKLGLNPGATSHVDEDSAGEMPNRETSSLVIRDSASIFGRDEEREMVVENICNSGIGKYENGEILVYGIWGMGGIGKTTLAKLVYDHEKVKQNFPLRCWVYVSEKFEVNEIIKKIIESIDRGECKLTQLDTLQVEVQGRLTGKKFLIVLDDVWIEDKEKAKWDELSKTLSCGEEGSIVVMTTRSSKTSQMMAKVDELQHKLGCLSKVDSWLLFSKFAFAQGRKGDAISVLEPIGREIVEKCSGLPLALKTLGSLMWSKKSTSDWEHVKGSIISKLQENNVLSVLKLSYDNLPLHFKRCLAYCCLFPKGYEMRKDELIQLWTANGFIPPKEDGEEILNCLVWRSFFQLVDTESYYENDPYEYKMHDLMHDMALHVMGDNCLVIESTGDKIPNEVFHLSSSCPEFVFSPDDLRNLASLRSILFFGKRNESRLSQIVNHMYLRVLYLCNLRLETLPESIGKLKHLRYLNLSNSRIRVLPESIIHLQNLQMLILFCCNFLVELPKGLRHMVNFQSLDIGGCYALRRLPVGIKELTRLRILSKFPLVKEGGAKIGELGDLVLLEGELEIEGLENVEGFSEAKSANLKCKRNLSVLKLSWTYAKKVGGWYKCDVIKEVLEGLEPNPGLKVLKISNYKDKIISPSWMVNLKNLIKISFSSCEKFKHIPPLGRLPNLRVIEMENMDCLGFHEDDTNMSGDNPIIFPSLQTLHISYCFRLVSLPSNLPKLRELRYKHEMGEDWPKVSHIPDVEIFFFESSDSKDEGDVDNDEFVPAPSSDSEDEDEDDVDNVEFVPAP